MSFSANSAAKLRAADIAMANARLNADHKAATCDAPSVASEALSRSHILDAACQAVTVDRAATHGAIENTFGQIAALWSARLGQVVTPEKVCIMLIDLKTARAWGNPAHGDNWVDIAGYAACGGEVSNAKGDA